MDEPEKHAVKNHQQMDDNARPPAFSVAYLFFHGLYLYFHVFPGSYFFVCVYFLHV